MKEIDRNQGVQSESAVLVGVFLSDQPNDDEALEELAGLAETAGAEVVGVGAGGGVGVGGVGVGSVLTGGGDAGGSAVATGSLFGGGSGLDGVVRQAVRLEMILLGIVHRDEQPLGLKRGRHGEAHGDRCPQPSPFN